MNKFLLAISLFIFLGFLAIRFFPLSDRKSTETEKQSQADQLKEKDFEVIAGNLEIPWEVAFLPFNSTSTPLSVNAQGEPDEILVSERPGTLLLLKNKQKIPVEGVEHVGEGGLLGLAIHLNFTSNHWIYLYLTSQTDKGLENRVERYQLEGNQLKLRQVILQGIVGAPNHDGGRIAFGPDGYLYVTTGDAQNENSAQNIKSLNGKILRVRDDGSIPADNPFGNAVYSYGHRNPQGLTWDKDGQLWATEHGQSALDELNLIGKGKNYGWPIIQGDEKKEGMINPVIQSGPSTTWAPAGAAYYNGSIFFGGLRGEILYEYKIADYSLKEHFRGQFGRIRAIVLGPDGNLYFTTSNRDGRGNPRADDDKIIRVNLNSL